MNQKILRRKRLDKTRFRNIIYIERNKGEKGHEG